MTKNKFDDLPQICCKDTKKYSNRQVLEGIFLSYNCKAVSRIADFSSNVMIFRKFFLPLQLKSGFN